MAANAPAAALQQTRRLGLPATVALVVGGIVGTGIVAIPAAVAPFGWPSIPVLAGCRCTRSREGNAPLI